MSRLRARSVRGSASCVNFLLFEAALAVHAHALVGARQELRTHAHAQGQRSSSLGVGEAAGPAIKLLLEALSLGAACRFLARRAVE